MSVRSLLGLISLALSPCFQIEAQDLAKPVDWNALFNKALDTNQEVKDKNMEYLERVIYPCICGEKPGDAASDLKGLTDFLDSDNATTRLNASAIIAVLSGCRTDSASTFSPLFSALEKHLHDSTPRVQQNSFITLTALRPAMPDEQLHFLLRIMEDDKNPFATGVPRGLAISARASPVAASALEQALRQNKSIAVKVAAIQAVRDLQLSEGQFPSIVGDLLTGTDQNIINESLDCLAVLKPAAIQMNQDKIRALEDRYSNTPLAKKAEEVLKRGEATQ